MKTHATFSRFNPWFNGFQIQSVKEDMAKASMTGFNPWFNGFQIQSPAENHLPVDIFLVSILGLMDFKFKGQILVEFQRIGI